jgi:hypothetical protein
MTVCLGPLLPTTAQSDSFDSFSSAEKLTDLSRCGPRSRHFIVLLEEKQELAPCLCDFPLSHVARVLDSVGFHPLVPDQLKFCYFASW